MLKDRLQRALMPRWADDTLPDEHHPHRRRYTTAYRRKRGIVKSVWIGSGLLMLAQPSLALILILLLGTTFLSFTILDETG